MSGLSAGLTTQQDAKRHFLVSSALTSERRTIALLALMASLGCPGISHAGTQLLGWSDSFGNAPADATNLIAVAGGDYHIVALRADGKVFAWGSNNQYG